MNYDSKIRFDYLGNIDLDSQESDNQYVKLILTIFYNFLEYILPEKLLFFAAIYHVNKAKHHPETFFHGLSILTFNFLLSYFVELFSGKL